jgi:hypothetical protein
MKNTLFKVELTANTKIITRKRIEQVMNNIDKQRTGLSKLTATELAALNSWLNTNAVVAPGPISN